MTTAIGSGPLVPVVSSPSSPVQAGPALPVYVYTSLPVGRSQSGAKPIPVKFLSASDLVQNGGSYTLAGPPTALPVISVAANVYGVQGGSALPVYDVTNLVYPQPQPNPPPVGPVLPDVASATLLLNLQADALSLADGDPVSAWANAGTLGGSATAAGNERPTKQSLNGFPYIVGDGVNDFLQLGPVQSAGLDALPSFTVFFAAIQKTSPTGTYVLFKGTVLGAAWRVDQNDLYVQTTNADTIGAYDSGAILDTPYVETTEFTGATANIYRNGVDVTVHDDFGTLTTYANSEPVQILTWAGFFSDDPIYAIMLYSPAPSASDRAAIEAWLAAKYGITP